MNFDEVFDLIEAEIEGRVATPRESSRVLIDHIKDFEGDHLEIGALYGGTIILTAMMKPHGKIFAIDPVDEHGYYGRDDQLIKGKRSRPNSEILRRNLAHFKVSNRVIHVNKFSHPFPIQDILFDTAYVDGDHTLEGAYQDFLSIRNIVRHVIVYDNFDDAHLGVLGAVNDAVRNFPEWKLARTEHNVGVLIRT